MTLKKLLIEIIWKKIKNEKEDLKEIEREYYFWHILEQINDGVTPEEIEFYFGGDNKNFFLTCASLGLSKDSENFVDFLSSNLGYKILTKNKITIHIEIGNEYFDKTNSNESLCDLFTTQQDEKKKLINASFSYGGDFRTYIIEFLMGIDAETDDRFDILTNKSVKYLFYRYNDFLLSKNLPTISIRHSKIVENYVAIKEIQNRNCQYLIKSLISRVEEENNDFILKTIKDSGLLKKIEKNYRLAICVYDSIYISLLLIIFYIMLVRLTLTKLMNLMET